MRLRSVWSGCKLLPNNNRTVTSHNMVSILFFMRLFVMWSPSSLHICVILLHCATTHVSFSCHVTWTANMIGYAVNIRCALLKVIFTVYYIKIEHRLILLDQSLFIKCIIYRPGMWLSHHVLTSSHISDDTYHFNTNFFYMNLAFNTNFYSPNVSITEQIGLDVRHAAFPKSI